MDCQEELLNSEKNRRDGYRNNAGRSGGISLCHAHGENMARWTENIPCASYWSPEKTRHNVTMARTEGSRHLLQRKATVGEAKCSMVHEGMNCHCDPSPHSLQLYMKATQTSGNWTDSPIHPCIHPPMGSTTIRGAFQDL